MRVLILSIAHFADTPGGGPRLVQDEARELDRRGDEVWVLAPGTAAQPEHEQREGIHLLRYVPAPVAPWNPARSSGHQRAVRALLARHLPRVDAVHGHAPLPYLAALDFYGDSVHFCYDIHSPARMEMEVIWRHSGLRKKLTAPLGLAMINRMERECIRRSDAVSAESQFTIDCIRKIHGPALAAKVQLLPGWVDSTRYTPVEDRERAKAQLGWPAGVPILFTLRRLAPRMGLDRLLDAVHRLQGEGATFHLLIGGSGPLRASLEKQSQRLGLTATVTFLGRIADEQLPLAYAACDAFVLPTADLECFGLIAVEALSAGRPVLATPVGAIPEILRHFDPAWLARSASAEDIAGLLRGYLAGRLPAHNPAELHELARHHYSRDILVPAYIDAMIGGNGRA
jgi:glycosyltransferase involved in cell wall biosynthesis